MSPRSSSTELLLFFPAALVKASCRTQEEEEEDVITREEDKSPADAAPSSSYLQFLLFHADFGVLLCGGQSGSQSLLPLALGPLGNRGGDGDGSLHDANRGVFR